MRYRWLAAIQLVLSFVFTWYGCVVMTVIDLPWAWGCFALWLLAALVLQSAIDNIIFYRTQHFLKPINASANTSKTQAKELKS